ncbi:hypothetical protein RI551_05095 [Lactiplantibacillus pentosus]|nr:hypothetical protein [Lactiplantibacillus pentosus]MDT6965728.1 hypothetical protein [Lactiplantibacillus pentosus]
MMPTNLTLLERKISNNLNCLYFVDHPVYRIQKNHQLVLAPEYASAGRVTEISCDDQQRYHIDFEATKELVLTEKKVVKVTNNMLEQSTSQFLATLGYQFVPNEPVGSAETAALIPKCCPLLHHCLKHPPAISSLIASSARSFAKAVRLKPSAGGFRILPGLMPVFSNLVPSVSVSTTRPRPFSTAISTTPIFYLTKN